MDKTLGCFVAAELRRLFEEQAADPGELTARKRFWPRMPFWRRKPKPAPAVEGALTLRSLCKRTGFERERIKRLLMGKEPLMVYENDILARHLGSTASSVTAAAEAASPDRPERVYSWAEAFKGL